MATNATIGTGTYSEVWRMKYFQSTLQTVLRKALVCEKIFQVDRSDEKYLANPYSSQPSADIAAIVGTYTVSAFTTTDNTISVTDQVTYGEHIFEFEETLSNFDLYASRVDDMSYAIATGIDKFVDVIANYKSSLIDSEIQKWITRAKEFISTLNDLTRGLQFLGMQKSELAL